MGSGPGTRTVVFSGGATATSAVLAGSIEGAVADGGGAAVVATDAADTAATGAFAASGGLASPLGRSANAAMAARSSAPPMPMGTHGGPFFSGTTATSSPSVLVRPNEVVVVTRWGTALWCIELMAARTAVPSTFEVTVPPRIRWTRAAEGPPKSPA